MYIRQAQGDVPVVTETNVVVQASTTNIVIQATPSPESPQPAAAGPSAAPAPPADPNSPPAAESSIFLDGESTSDLASTFIDPGRLATTQTGEFTLSNAVPLATGDAQSTNSGTATGKSENSTKPLSPGLISGIVICMILVIMAVVAVGFNYRRRRNQGRDYKASDDTRSTVFWDKPPRPVMRGPSVSLANKWNKNFAPPSHTLMHTAPTASDPYRDSTATDYDIELPGSRGMPPPPSAGPLIPELRFHDDPNSPGGSPFADPSPLTPMPPMAYGGSQHAAAHIPEGAGSPELEIHNPFADPRESYHGAVAL